MPRKMLNRCEATSLPSPLAVYSIASTDIDPFWEKNASEPGLFGVVDARKCLGNTRKKCQPDPQGLNGFPIEQLNLGRWKLGVLSFS